MFNKYKTNNIQKSDNELHAKIDALELMQEMSNLGSWELDLQTMQITWSKASYRIYNVALKDGPPEYLEFLNMVLPQYRKKLIQGQKDILDDNIHKLEIKLERNDGKIVTVIETAKLIRENNEPVKIIGTTLDITHIREQDEILMQQSKSAQMGEMINMIAHQWRQPLNAISAASIKLKMQNNMNILTKEEVNNIASFIEDMTQKMSQTINDFMNFTKPDNKQELVSFNQIIDDILKIIGLQLKNHNIKLNIDIEPNINIYTHKKEIEHILMNIISNARDALEDLDDNDKNIFIKIYQKNQLCVIKIADNAGGIQDDMIQRIFDPYFTTKETNKGTGLGLYMSKKILQEHLQGDIYVRNKDNGAEFTILLDKNNE